MNEIRVLHIIDNLDQGGVQSYLFEYLKAMKNLPIVFDFIVQRPQKGKLEDKLASYNSRIYHFPHLLLERKSFAEKLNCFLDEHNEYSIVEVHQNFYVLLPLYIAKKQGIPVRIAHAHSCCKMPTLYLKLYLTYFRFIITFNANVFWGCSTKANRWLYGLKNLHKAKVIPNAIDTKKFKFNISQRNVIREQYKINGLCIGHIGTGGVEKNYEFLIRVFNKIHINEPNSKLLLIGCDSKAKMS